MGGLVGLLHLLLHVIGSSLLFILFGKRALASGKSHALAGAAFTGMAAGAVIGYMHPPEMQIPQYIASLMDSFIGFPLGLILGMLIRSLHED